MATPERKPTGKVFMSGRSQAVRVPKEYRFDCNEVAIRRVGRHIILSPRFTDWEDYWTHSSRPTDDFVESIRNRHENEWPLEERRVFD